MKKDEQYKAAAEKAAKQQQKIQDGIARADKKHKDEEKEEAMQAGARKYPAPPISKQHLEKPGIEADLRFQPMCDAPYYKGSEKLKDMVAIITGGDSGIGRAVAILFAREGADVAIAYLNEHEDAEDTKKMVEAEGRKSILISGDVTDKSFCTHAIQRTVDELGKLDILVNNAAFQLHVKDIADLSEYHLDTTLKTNLYGYFFMAQAAIPHMKPGSSIINSGSVTGLMGNDNLLDYSLTKGGIHSFTRSLATCATRGDSAGLCIPRITAVLQLYYG